MAENIDNFLKELKELSIKHKMTISGCGCCGSPIVCNINDNEIEDHEYTAYSNFDYYEYLTWDKKKDGK